MGVLIGIAASVALTLVSGEIGAGLTGGGIFALSMGVNGMGAGRWMKTTEPVQASPRQRVVIKLSIGLALVGALVATVTQSGSIGYVAFGLSLPAGIVGTWVFVGPRTSSVSDVIPDPGR
jgi:hypothetical protein